MKWHIYFLFLFALLSVDYSYAQVERIGMRGVADFRIIGQLGNTLFATSGDKLNYYRSADGGDSWSLFIDGLPISSRSYVSSLKVNGEIIIFQVGSGEYQTSESSSTWSFYQYPLVNDSLPDYIYHISKDTLFTLLSYNSPMVDGIYFSYNKGLTWKKADLNYKYLYDYPLVVANRILLPSYHINDTTIHFGLSRSDDYGKNWQNSSGGLPDSSQIGSLQYLCGTVFASGLYCSFDKGENWNIINEFKDSNWLSYNIFEHNGKIFLVGSIWAGQTLGKCFRDLFISEDSGRSWSLYFQDSAVSHQISKFFVCDSRIIAEAPKKHFLIAADNKITPFNNRDGLYQYTNILCVNNDTIYALNNSVDQKDSISISYNNGDSWQNKLFIKNQKCQGNWLLKNDDIYTYGLDISDSLHYLYCSTDKGNSWKTKVQIPLPTKLLNHSVDVQGDTMVCEEWWHWGNYVSIDAGKSWTSVGHLFPETDDAGSRIHGGKFFIVGYDYGGRNRNLWHSYNIGATWDTFPQPQGYIISRNPEMLFIGDTLYLLAYRPYSLGHKHYTILKTTNDGYSWSYPEIGFPDSTSINTFMKFGNIMYTAVSNSLYSTIYFSKDNAVTWKEHYEPLLNTASKIFANKKYLFLSSSDHLYRIPLQQLSVSSSTDYIAEPFKLDQISPNPSKSIVNVRYTILQPQKKLLISLFDETGKLCSSYSAPTLEGENVLNVNIGNLPSGSYTLVLSSDTFKSQQTLLIAR